MLRLPPEHDRTMSDLNLLMGLSAFAFILGFIAGIAVSKRGDDAPRDPLARDVYTPGHKLVAMPHAHDRRIKPSIVWPRQPVQRVQSQVERWNDSIPAADYHDAA